VIFYFVQKIKHPGAARFSVGFAFGETLALFIFTYIIFAIVKFFTVSKNPKRTHSSSNKAYLITWGILFIVNVNSLVSEKVDFTEEKSATLKSALVNFKEKYGTQFDTIMDVEKYFDCALTKIYQLPSNEIDKALLNLKNPNSKSFNEILLPCFQKALIYKSSNTSDVYGFVASDTIQGVAASTGTKINLIIGNSEYYYLIDSGSTELLISSKMLQEYREKNPGLIITELPSSRFSLANGEIRLFKRFQFDKVQLGKFIIPNVIFAISEEDCTPLLGQDILKRFYSWSIIDNNEKLILIK
jgi:energy-coupling factor transporter transmembrane protein EcfT